MKKWLCVVTLAVAVLVIAGCGGSVSGPAAPEGSVHAAEVDLALVGTWQGIVYKLGGVETSVPIACDAPTKPWTLLTIQFGALGGYVQTFYVGSTPNQVERGTYNAVGGTLTLNKTGGGSTSATYTLNGNVMISHRTVGGKDQEIRWAKFTTLTGHDPALAKTWKATGLWLNGAALPLSTALRGYPGDSAILRFRADGVEQKWNLLNWIVVQPSRASNAWSSGGGTFKYGPGVADRGLYTVGAGGNLTLWILVAGNTQRGTFAPLGMAGNHPANVLGRWRATSVTADGIPISLKTYFAWAPTGSTERIDFWDDGVASLQEIAAGGALTIEMDRKWATSGSTFTTGGLGGPVVMNYTLVGSTLTWTLIKSGHTYVVTWTKVP